MVFLTKFKNTFFGVLKRPLNLESGEFRFHPGIDIESEILVKLLCLSGHSCLICEFSLSNVDVSLSSLFTFYSFYLVW